MKRKSLIFILLSVLISLVLAGCDSGKSKQEVEVVSPTGCLKSQGRYYDPKTKTCVKVDNQHQALVLDSYRYVNKLAEEGKLKEAEYRINFKTFITVQKAEALWTELRDHEAKMYVLGGAMPDNGLNSASPKIWSGLGLPMGWQKFANPDTKLERGTINEMLDETLVDLEDKDFLPDLRKAIKEDDNFMVGTMSVITSPDSVLDFWNRHIDEIEAIQPIVNIIDEAQGALGPAQPYTEEQE